jgi:hypothetical protein
LPFGDFAPAKALADGRSVTGPLDLESVPRVDVPFDVAWWNRPVSFASPAVLQAAGPPFRRGADADDPVPAGRGRTAALGYPQTNGG